MGELSCLRPEQCVRGQLKPKSRMFLAGFQNTSHVTLFLGFR